MSEAAITNFLPDASRFCAAGRRVKCAAAQEQLEGHFWCCTCRTAQSERLRGLTISPAPPRTPQGIVFSVRPPKKSWKNISNLSGGEKTLSSLSLVFALHHFRPTPLYVMDEIDAALGAKLRPPGRNTPASFLNQHRQPGPPGFPHPSGSMASRRCFVLHPRSGVDRPRRR